MRVAPLPILPITIIALAMTLTSHTLQAQNVAQQRAAIQGSWQAFTADQGPGWQVDWKPATATPRAIYGPGLRLQAGPVRDITQARQLAAGVIEAQADLLGRGQSNFVEVIGAKAARVWVFVYRQEYRGLEVIGGRADIRIHENGVLSMFGSVAPQIPDDISLRPGIAAQLAEFNAYRDREIDPQQPGPLAEQERRARLVLWTDLNAKGPGPLHLAWEVEVDQREGLLVVGKSYVDAQTGRVLEYRDEVYSCGEHAGDRESEHSHGEDPAAARKLAVPAGINGSVRAWANTGLRPTDALSNIPLRRLKLVWHTASGTFDGFTDEFGNFTIPDVDEAILQIFLTGQHVGLVNTAQGNRILVSGLVTSAMPDIRLLDSAATEFDWTQTTVYWATDNINVWVRDLMQPNPPQLGIISRVSATVNINQSCNAFYTGNSINFYPTQGSCNTTAYSTVIYHEWGHGLDDAFGGISQIDGLSEGWGDIMAMFRSGQAIVGEDFSISGGFLRTGNNSRTYPATGSVHTQGQTWMGFAWDVRQILTSTLGPIAGPRRAEEIFINSIIADATNQPDAVLEVFLLDDDDGILGNGTPNYQALKAAAERRLLPFPALMEVTVDHVELASTVNAASPRLVQATVTPVFGSVVMAEVVYDSGSGAQRREMVLGQEVDEYLAILPATESPARMEYHFEISHSSGVVARHPSTGGFSYGIGTETEVFADDFEGGALGWGHGVQFKEDDWQQSLPQGSSGPFPDGTWRDPSSAYSGLMVFGNDLGLAGFDGAYENNVGNFLLSPVLNLTGRSGLTLSFQRWLTVEEGIFDQATITVNGAPLWANPLQGHLVDQAWVEQRIPLPSWVDNNPSVQISWNLRTDVGLEFGGWNIDDVRVLALQAAPPPALEFTMTPAQIDIGTSSQVNVTGTPDVPMVIALSDSPGPTVIPGLVTLELGTIKNVRSFILDGMGELNLVFNVPPDPSLVGSVTYAQAVELTDASTLTVSNPVVFLISP